MKSASMVFLCFALISFNANGQAATQNGERTLRIKGIAILKQTPEIISAAINLKIESKEYNVCNDKLMMTQQKAREIFINKGIDKNLIRTNEIRVTESKVYKNGEEVKLGFVGSVSLIIESVYSAEFTRKLMSGLKTDSLAFNYNIAFKLSELQKESLRKKAISRAIEDAQEKALLIAESSKVKLVKINSIIYRDDSYVSSGANDNDIIKEFSWNSNEVFYLRGASVNNPTIDFNPKEIRIVKAVEMEWIITDIN